jgi:hypothetical protein
MLQPCEKCRKITTWDFVPRPTQERVADASAKPSALEPLANQLGVARCRECGSRGCFALEPDGTLGIDEQLAEPDLVELFTESLEAEKRGQVRLALMGYRGVLDLCLNRRFGRDLGTFVGKLEEAHNRGYLSQIELHHLEVILTAGHALAHGRFNPEAEVLPWVRSITFRLIKNVYENQDVNMACQFLTDQYPAVNSAPG